MINKNEQKVLSTSELLDMLGGVQSRYDDLSKVVLVIEPKAVEYFKKERERLVEDIVKILEEAAKTQTLIAERCKEYQDDDDVIYKESQSTIDEAVEAYQAGIRTCEFIHDKAQKLIQGARALSFGNENELSQMQ